MDTVRAAVDLEGAHELPTLSTAVADSHPSSPTTLSAQSSMVALRVAGLAGPQEGTTVQELPPVDRGVGAWMFCAGGFVSEMMVWGFSFRFGFLY